VWAPEDVRAASAFVAERARLVRIDHERLDAFVLPAVPRAEPVPVEFALTVNAINFGSGWHPYLSKMARKSGNVTISTHLRERFQSEGPFTAEELVRLTADDCAAVLHQHIHPPVDELMGLFAQSLNDLGRFLLERFGGSFQAFVDSAGGSAVELVRFLQEMPLYRDASTYRGREIPFLKRAQITASDIGTFDDLGALTIFADNLIPHVLWVDGVLNLEPSLAAAIEAQELLQPGGHAEVELRASAVRVGELLARRLGVAAREVDAALWNAGQDDRYKAVPRPRIRTCFY